MSGKAALRTQMLQQRKAASPGFISAASQHICEKFFQEFDLNSINTLHVFLSIPDKGEIDTWLIIHKIWREFPRIRLAVPVTPPGAKELTHRQLTPGTKLVTSKWGIDEPTDQSPIVSEPRIDLVLVPLLAFDLQGHRVGYGKGYYDKFLSKCRPDAIKAGLSLFPPTPKIDDAGAWDVPLDLCITPEKIYKF